MSCVGTEGTKAEWTDGDVFGLEGFGGIFVLTATVGALVDRVIFRRVLPHLIYLPLTPIILNYFICNDQSANHTDTYYTEFVKIFLY